MRLMLEINRVENRSLAFQRSRDDEAIMIPILGFLMDAQGFAKQPGRCFFPQIGLVETVAKDILVEKYSTFIHLP